MFHVTSVRNRESILTHGLDWTRMGAAPGIAGSSEPEADGVFLCPDDFDVEFFLGLNNTGGPVDVWAVDVIDEGELVTSAEGFAYLPVPIARDKIHLAQRDVERPERDLASRESQGAYRSTLVVTFDDDAPEVKK